MSAILVPLSGFPPASAKTKVECYQEYAKVAVGATGGQERSSYARACLTAAFPPHAHIDDKVAPLRLAKIGAKLTKMTPEQATYLGVPQAGPFEAEKLWISASAQQP